MFKQTQIVSKIKTGVFYPLEYSSGKQNLLKEKIKHGLSFPVRQQRRKDLLGSVEMMKEACQKQNFATFLEEMIPIGKKLKNLLLY